MNSNSILFLAFGLIVLAIMALAILDKLPRTHYYKNPDDENEIHVIPWSIYLGEIKDVDAVDENIWLWRLDGYLRLNGHVLSFWYIK